MFNKDNFRKELKKIVDTFGEGVFLEPRTFYEYVIEYVEKGEDEKKELFLKLIDSSIFVVVYQYRDEPDYIKKEVINVSNSMNIDLSLLFSFTEDLLFALGKNIKLDKVVDKNNNNVETDRNKDLIRQGDDYFKNYKYQDAYDSYLEAFKNGSLLGMLKVGFMLINGYGTPKDLEKGFNYIKEAAKRGLKEAFIILADCYHNGQGVKTDFVKALYWYKKAADAGLAEGYFQLGVAFSRGFGVPRLDYKKAKKFFRIAADMGHPYALEALNELIEKENEVDY